MLVKYLIPETILQREKAHDIQSINVTSVTADSRNVTPGTLFVALKGVRVHAEQFIPDAVKRGAVLIITDQTTNTAETHVPIIQTPNPRKILAQIAARFHSPQPETIAATTGTNGKTSVCEFLRQIWNQKHINAASIGTLGVIQSENNHTAQARKTALTTPDPVQLHATLAHLAKKNINHIAMEISSHALHQYRADGVMLKAAAFTNLSQDHMDYHTSFEDYFKAKARLFTDLLPETETAVINIDSQYGNRLRKITQNRKIKTITIGENKNAQFHLQKLSPTQNGINAEIRIKGEIYQCRFPLPGKFQLLNALTALALADAVGSNAETHIPMLESLKPICGRMEPVGHTKNGAQIIIDYAHTPDALNNALTALRFHKPNNLIVIFGAGGDRDQKKRPMMGAVAHQKADHIYITDDNPRSENPRHIREQIMQTCPRAHNVEGRENAIKTALQNAQNGDIVLIAGKGHETGQILKDQTIPFSDHECVGGLGVKTPKKNKCR